MVRKHVVLSVVLAATVVTGACRKGAPQGGTDAPTPAPAPTPPTADGGPTPATPSSATLAPPTGTGARSGFERFWSYEPPEYEVKAQPGSLPVSLEGIEVPPIIVRQYGLDDAAQELLAQNGFVVTSGPSTEGLDEIYKMYEWLATNAPVFVTADTALHLYHLVFDTLLMSVEQQYLTQMLVALADALRAEALEAAAGSGTIAEAALTNLAVFDVIRKLLDTSAEVDSRVREQVTAELALIDARAGFGESAVFGYDEDYSQYIPRGHYTRSPRLTAYFKAMMWIGRMSYLLKAEDDPSGGLVQAEDARRFAVMAAQVSRWLAEAQVAGRPAEETWQRIYSVTAFFAGFSDDLTPVEIRPAVDSVLEAAAGFESLLEPGRADLLRARIAALRAPRVNSGTAAAANLAQILANGDTGQLFEATARTTGMRLMGQRYTPDADVMGRLAVPAVGAPLEPVATPPFTLVETQQGPARGFARGLDVMALLGSARARPILESLHDLQYANYDEAFEKARKVFPPADDPAWHGNLYWSWLGVLRDYVTPRPTPTQAFETGDAWADHVLTTALTSWAQLRHDTILYVKQPYAEGAGCAAPGLEPPPPPPQGFVEPNPEVFARLIAVNEMTLRGLRELGVLPERAGDVLTGVGELLAKLRDLAIKEIEDRAIDAADNEFLVGFGASCAGLLQRVAALSLPPTGADDGSYAEMDTKTTLAADVMTCVDAGEVLEEGSGLVEALTVAMRAPGLGTVVLATGPVLTYHEFRWPMQDRLTDEKWRHMLQQGQAPSQPPWVCSFRSPCPAPAAAGVP